MSDYIKNINFDPKLKNTAWAKYLVNFRLALLLIVGIFAFGIVNYSDIPRRLQPEVDIPIIAVNTTLVGATPEDIESLVTIPIEDKIKSIEGLDTMSSTSQPNSSVIILQFLSNIDSDKARDDVQEAVDGVSDLPEDAQTPRVIKFDFENRPVWTFALSSNDIPTLMSFSKKMEEDLKNLKNIGSVETSGFEEQEIQVVIEPKKINEYNISPVQISQAISSAISTFPAGSVSAFDSNFSLAIDKDVNSVDDIRKIQINNSGKVIFLEQLAEIKEVSKNDLNKNFLKKNSSGQKRAVQFLVYKSASSNITDAIKDAEGLVFGEVEKYKENIEISSINNYGQSINDQFSDLVREFSTTITLIFVVLLIFLGLRQALVASFTVPLTFLLAIGFANMLGMSLNFLTMFSFLIALGLLIDDTIVVVTAMTRYYASGKFTPQETGMLVWRDFITPLWTTTATTLWSFIPLLLATGIIGEFIKPIPIIISATMLSSTSIAVLITIPLMIIFLKPKFPKRVLNALKIFFTIFLLATIYLILPKSLFSIPIALVLIAIFATLFIFRKAYFEKIKGYVNYKKTRKIKNILQKLMSQGLINLDKVSDAYRRTINNILSSKSKRKSVLTFLVVFAVLSYLLIPLKLVKNEFFPKTDEDILYISVDVGSGKNLQTVEKKMTNLVKQIDDTDGIKYILSETGYSLNSNMDREISPSNFLVTLALENAEERDLSSIQIANDLRNKFKNYQEEEQGNLSVIETSGGPPAGADIQITFLGKDFDKLTQYTNQAKNYLEKKEGITNVETSFKPGNSKLVFVPDGKKLAEEGITRESLAFLLRTYAAGLEIDSIRLDTEKDINLVMKKNPTAEEIGTLNIQTQKGSIPLISLGSLQLKENPIKIDREDSLRSITISASVSSGYNTSRMGDDLEKYAKSIDMEQGYSWKTGGINEENQKSIESIMQAMVVSFILILITMVVEFGSFRQALIVMLTIPLAVSGVFYVFGLTNTPLSFPALIGVLALFGIVVTNAIVVIDKINSNLKEGMEFKKAILDAAGSRLEPVLLTSLTTIFGLLPITLSDPLWRGLGGAIIAGLFFSGMIKLFFIPVVYYEWFKEEYKNKLKKL